MRRHLPRSTAEGRSEEDRLREETEPGLPRYLGHCISGYLFASCSVGICRDAQHKDCRCALLCHQAGDERAKYRWGRSRLSGPGSRRGDQGSSAPNGPVFMSILRPSADVIEASPRDSRVRQSCSQPSRLIRPVCLSSVVSSPTTPSQSKEDRLPYYHYRAAAFSIPKVLLRLDSLWCAGHMHVP